MGFHHQGAHGRVFRGLKKSNRKTAPVHKRDDDAPQRIHHNAGGDRTIMHVPEGFAAKPETNDSGSQDQKIDKLANKAQANDDSGVETVYTKVFKTLDQTFDGPPQFFSTAEPEPTSTSAPHPAVHTTAAADNSRQNQHDDSNNPKNNDNDEQTPSRKPVAQSTPTSSASSEHTVSNPASTHHAAMSTEKDEPSPTPSMAEVTASSVMTGDASATTDGMIADSTSSMFGGKQLGASHSASVSPTPSAEPEQTGMTSGAKAGLAMGLIFGLGLVFGLVFFCWRRKKNQRGLEEHNEKSGFDAAAAPVNRFSTESDRVSDHRSSTKTSATAPRLSLRPVTQFLPNITGDNRKSIGNLLGAMTASNGNQQQQGATQNPFGDAAGVSEKRASSSGESDNHERANSINSQESSVPPTPGSAQFATAAAVPVARGPNNVHRVQLDFKPSMDDELELKSGQLVRMLHEYDDGWALCTRMDRSQKGVVPRTCLSKMPVKPRGPPPANRPPPSGPNPAPNAMPSPAPAAPNPPGMLPRPLTPTQQGRPRAPTLDGVPARKPVPGQAL